SHTNLACNACPTLSHQDCAVFMNCRDVSSFAVTAEAVNDINTSVSQHSEHLGTAQIGQTSGNGFIDFHDSPRIIDIAKKSAVLPPPRILSNTALTNLSQRGVTWLQNKRKRTGIQRC